MEHKQPNIEMLRKRLYAVAIFILLILSFLSIRLAFLQLASSITDNALLWDQSVLALDGFDSRGTIYDTDLNPLTGASKEYIYIMDQTRGSARREIYLSLISAQKISSNLNYDVYHTPVFNQHANDVLQQEFGAFVIKTTRRYSDPQIACHLIGYMNRTDKQGSSGLEKSFNDLLSENTKKLFARIDATGSILPGLGVSVDGISSQNGVITSIRADLQKEAESILQEEGRRSSLIVTNAATGELLVCASYPSFNPGNVEAYLESDRLELFNQALQGQYPPGSIFKIVVAAAALESGVAEPSTVFHCNGYTEINGIRIRCSSGGEQGHGDITLQDAFAKSCNSTFIQLGMMTGGEKIVEMARAFGFGEPVLGGIVEESAGLLPEASDIQGAGIGNLSIGQGRLLVTPIQISKMLQIIVNDGQDMPIQLIKGSVHYGAISFQEPLTVETGTFEPAKQVISREHAKILQKMMADTVLYGTADNFSVGEIISAGGKTGSAQSSLNGEKVVHAWFTGFVPADEPEFIITVLVEDGGSGRAMAVPLFEKMAVALEEQVKSE